MSSSKFKFLLDENVRMELYKFLKDEEIDVKFAPKGLFNGELAKLSLKKRRVLVTNDGDFSHCSSEKIFGVVWLKIPQHDVKKLLKSFSLLLELEFSELKGKLVVLRPDKFEISSF